MAKDTGAGQANRKRRSSARRSTAMRVFLGVIVLAVIAAGLGLYSFREPVRGYGAVSTAYAARVACSCRFIAGRTLEDCAKDKLEGMELVTLVDNPRARSVTARFPLISSDTARVREGYGCVLDEWDGQPGE